MLIAQAAEGRDWLDVAEHLGPYVVSIVSVLGALLIAEVAHRRERERSLEVQRLQMADAERIRREEAAAVDARWQRDRLTDTVLETLEHLRQFADLAQQALQLQVLALGHELAEQSRLEATSTIGQMLKDAWASRRAATSNAQLLAAHGFTHIADRVIRFPDAPVDFEDFIPDHDPERSEALAARLAGFTDQSGGELAAIEQAAREFLTGPSASSRP